MGFPCKKRLKRFVSKINMSRTLLCKLLQRKTYDVLSKKYTILLLFFGVIVILVASLHFGEVMMEWSREKYSAVFNPYSDNIVGRSFRSMLCQYVPIDAVYTWVNGSDPLFLKHLHKTKRDYGFINNQNCSFSNCIKSHMVLVRPQISSSITLSDLEESGLEHVYSIFTVASPLSHEENITVLVFQDIHTADQAVEMQYLTIGDQNYTTSTAFITDSWWSQSTLLLNDVFLLTHISSELSEQQIIEYFPDNIKKYIEKVFYQQDKHFAVLTLSHKDILSSVMKIGNVSIEDVSARIVSAYLVVETLSEHEDISASRFADNEELRYSLRSLERHAPWIQHVYIISNGQIPFWLNLDNPRVTIVTHEEIFPNKTHLPTFSSPAIECHLHRIPNLSKKFLYLNDDVMFGKDVWPEDFYSHTKGQKVYLSWPVPNCAEGCPSSWIKDGSCDRPCNNSQCQWDGGDCSADSPMLPYHGFGMLQDASMTNYLQLHSKKDYCNDECVDTWLADRYCDKACNVKSCGYDMADCGVENFYKLHQLTFSDTQTFYYLPQGVTVGFFNLTSFLSKNCSITEGTYEENPVVRTMAVSLKFQILGIVLHPHHNSTNITIKLKVKNESITFEKEFYLNVCTKSPPLIKSQTPASVTFNQTKESIVFEEFAEKFRFPQVGSTPSGSMPQSMFQNVNASASNLPKNITSQLKSSEAELDAGIITHNGFLKKKAQLISNYVASFKGKSLPHLVYNEKPELFKTRQSHLNSQNIKTSSLSPAIITSLAAQDANSIKKSQLQNSNTNSRTEIPDKIPAFKFQELLEKTTHSAPSDSPLRNYFKQISNSSLQKVVPSSYETAAVSQRHLLDTFGDSLRHVNKLYNEAFGFESRKVPSHIAHFIDKNVMSRLTSRFKSPFDVTSAHKIRSSDDMQFAFSYYYYMMSEMESVSVGHIFDSFDIDMSGTWSDREIRTLLTRMYDLPLSFSTVSEFEEHINNCSLLAGILAADATTPPYERYSDSKLTLVTKSLICSCKPVSEMLLQHFGERKRNDFQVMGEEEVAFKMIHNNLSQVLGQIDDLRKNPRKFVCLNDNMKHGTKEADIIRAVIQDFYESLFPTRSSFELPPEYRNRFLYMNQLREWRKTRDIIRTVTYLSLAALILFSVVSFWKAEIRTNDRHARPRYPIHLNRNSMGV